MDFWKNLLESHFDKSASIIEDYVPPFALSESEYFELLLKVAHRIRASQSLSQFRFLVGDGAIQHVKDVMPHLPLESDPGISEYKSRLENQLEGKKWGMIVNGIHNYDAKVARQVLDFFEPLVRAKQVPVNSISPDIFLGNYQETAFGLHKDDQHAFTYVVHGKKKFIFYPFDALSESMGLDEDDRDKPQMTTMKRDLPDSDQSYELELRAGKGLMYWPPSYWHMAKSDGELCATMAVGLTTHPTYKILKNLSDRLIGAYLDRGEVNSIENQLDKNEIESQIQDFEAFLQSKKATDLMNQYGAYRGKTVQISPAFSVHPIPEMSLQTTLLTRKDYPFFHREIGEKILVSCFEQVFYLPNSSEIRKILQTLLEKSQFEIRELAESLDEPEDEREKLEIVTSVLRAFFRFGYLEVSEST